MGWNSWNFFRCSINETIIKEVADAIVSSGLKAAGYLYVNIDDCWMEKRGEDGRIIPFASRFPSGMKSLADYIHSKGLKFGVYSDTGNHTCEGYPGSWGYEKLDAQTYAEWGVDYLKYDYCGMDKAHESVQQSYERMRDALAATGRPILYSLCSWGSGQPWLWGHGVGNSWRTGIDVFAAWSQEQAKDLLLPSFLQPVLGAVRQTQGLAAHAGPGSFNDPDMLVVGLDGMYPYGIVQQCPKHIKGCKPGEYISRDRWGKVGGLTQTQQRSHFSLWCMMAAPLILGNDPRHMSKATLQVLLAREVIAINQDPLAKQGAPVWTEGQLEVWSKELSGDRTAVLLFNLGREAADITTIFSRDMPEVAKKWARDVPGNDPVCVDKDAECPKWAKNGECTNNPGFMLDRCPKSCPEGCPHPIDPPGPKATALVRDAWLEEDLGIFTSKFTALKVEPDEARMVVLSWIEPSAAAALPLETGPAAYANSLRNSLNALGIAVAPNSDNANDEGKASTGKDGEAGAEAKAFMRAKELETEVQRLHQELRKANTQISKLQQEADEVQCSKGGGDGSMAAAVVSSSSVARKLVDPGAAVTDALPQPWLSSPQSQLSLALNMGLVGVLVLVLMRPRRAGKTQKDSD